MMEIILTTDVENLGRAGELVRVKSAKLINNAAVSIARKSGKDQKLFGSVGTRDIVEALADQNIVLDRKLVQLPEPIKTTGTYEIPVKFNPDIIATLKVNVIGI